MLLDFYGIKVTQENIIQAAEAETTIEKDGIRLDQLSTALERVAPGYALLYKEDATIKDIETLIQDYRMPVVVNWQGLFYPSLEEENLGGELSHGHYSLVTDIDVANDTVTIVDPYAEFIRRDRVFPIGWFKSRWWDTSEKKDSQLNKDISYYTSRLIFVVAPVSVVFPHGMQLQKVPHDYLQEKFEIARRSYSHHPEFEKRNAFKTMMWKLSRVLKRS